MPEILILIILLVLAAAYVGLIIGIIRYNKSKLREKDIQKRTAIQKEKARIEAEKYEKQKQLEEAEKRKTICPICGECSMGEPICIDCTAKSKILAKEMPISSFKNYEEINEYKDNLMYNVIFAETAFEKETNSLKLIIVTIYLKEKYHDKKIFKDVYEFLKKVSQIPAIDKNILAKEYNLKKTNEKERKYSNDYRSNYEKPYRCEDGDYVRSKAEREIDDFFFHNRIWHIYENTYINERTGQKYYPDFYLPDYKVYIEYFGLNDKKYEENMNKKIKMFRSDPKIRFAYLTNKDDSNIKDKLSDICRSLNIKTH